MEGTTLSKCSKRPSRPADLVSFELRDFYEELNESSGIGLTASELTTVVEGNLFNPFVGNRGNNCDSEKNTSGALLQSTTEDSSGASGISVIHANIRVDSTTQSAGLICRIDLLKLIRQPPLRRNQEQLKGAVNPNSPQSSQLSVQNQRLQKEDPVRLCPSLQQFHNSDRKSSQVIRMVKLLQNLCRPTTKDLLNFLLGLGELSCVNSVTGDVVTEPDPTSVSTNDGLEEPSPWQVVKEPVKAAQQRPLLATPPLPLFTKIGPPAHREPHPNSQAQKRPLLSTPPLPLFTKIGPPFRPNSHAHKRFLLSTPPPPVFTKISAPAHKPRPNWKSTFNQHIHRTRKLPELMAINLTNNSGNNFLHGFGDHAPITIGPPRTMFAQGPNLFRHAPNNFRLQPHCHQSFNPWLPEPFSLQFPPS